MIDVEFLMGCTAVPSNISVGDWLFKHLPFVVDILWLETPYP